MGDLQLEFVQILTRHGFRTPLTLIPHDKDKWECEETLREHQLQDHPLSFGSCYTGQLTSVGIQQMTELGSEFGKKYIQQLKFLDPNFLPEHFFIRSTGYRRTIETAQCIIIGMYPSLHFSQFLQEKNPSEDQHADKIPIHILRRDLENMYPRGFCPRLQILQQQIQQTSEWKKAEIQVEPLKQQIITEVYHNSGVPVPPTEDFWVGLHNTALILEKHNFKLPPTLENKENMRILDVIARHAGWEGYMLHKTAELCRLTNGLFVRDLVDRFEEKVKGPNIVGRKIKGSLHEALTGKNLKFALYSGHDTSLLPLLNGFKIYDGYHPPMGSYLAMELYKEKNSERNFIKIIYNGEEKPLPECKEKYQHGELCPYEEFVKIARELIPDDFEKECRVK